MSGAPDTGRQDAPGGTPVDQGARAQDIQVIEDNDTPDDIVESMRRQLVELEAARDENQKRLEAEQRLRADAEHARRQAEERAAQADQQARQAQETSQRSTAAAQLDMVKASLDAHAGQMSALEAEHEKAMAEGEFGAAAKVLGKISVLGGKIAQLESGKLALEEQVKAEPQGGATDTGRQTGGQQQQQPSEYDRREAFIRARSQNLQTWLRGPHGDRFFNDRSFQEKVAAAAQHAEKVRGMSPESQAYIDYIETEVGLRQQQSTQDGQQQQGNARGRDADTRADEGRRMTTAPAGGATGGSVRSNPDGSTTVRLTRAEMDIADSMGVSHAEYARNKRNLLQENLIGPGARR